MNILVLANTHKLSSVRSKAIPLSNGKSEAVEI